MVLAVIMSGDACFTQRRNKGKGGADPPRQHPSTVFVPADVTRKMDAFVETVRPPRAQSKKSKKKSHLVDDDDDEEEVEDHFEDPQLPVPKSVLDDCEASFAAADERRMKSSTQFFDDTGLMGLVCRHDHALFLVNMKSAGEKQSNMFALLETFLSHLPRSFLVGFLYDIACNLERSARKYNLLPPEYLERLQFAVSVLHAFGHHWKCQMQYHPRRRPFFGFSDGEGCERFWHSISKLISYLRVCGVSVVSPSSGADIELTDISSSSIGACTRWTRRFITRSRRAYGVWELGLRGVGPIVKRGGGKLQRR